MGKPIPARFGGYTQIIRFRATLQFEIQLLFFWLPDKIPIWQMSDDDKILQSRSLKDLGNTLCQSKEYLIAQGKYLKVREVKT